MSSVKVLLGSILVMFLFVEAKTQEYYWQQQADYDIAIDFDVQKDLFRGTQTIKYHNNSPDTLWHLYFHMFYNAFQPNSMMDQWHRSVPDPQYGLEYELKYLTSSETGWLVVNSFLINSKQCELNPMETLLKVTLAEAIPPKSTAELKMSFVGRVPLLCRRTGRDNEEGVDYTIAKWYPKIAVYDRNGWNKTPFIGREFYSNFGDYDVHIKLDSNYVIAAGADQVFTDTIPNSNKKKWRFVSKNVLDFSWAADTEYTHFEKLTEDGILLKFYYLKDEHREKNWLKMADPLSWVFTYINNNYGKYPYNSYSIIQAGDGATEYAKSTFITGNRTPGSLVGVSIHEIMHSWFQHKIATDETRFAWMDEGFASYASTLIKQEMREKGIFFKNPEQFLFENQYKDYLLVMASGFEEAMSTQANYFDSNAAYYMASYSKGELFLDQLNYMLGEEHFKAGMREYLASWSFRHPGPQDFINIMENVSGLELSWYLQFWVETTDHIDYSVRLDSISGGQSVISLSRIGKIPMPLHLEIVYTDDSVVDFLIPLNLMNGHRKLLHDSTEVMLESWPWPHPSYQIELNSSVSDIKSIKLDPKLRMADINRLNNLYLK